MKLTFFEIDMCSKPTQFCSKVARRLPVTIGTGWVVFLLNFCPRSVGNNASKTNNLRWVASTTIELVVHLTRLSNGEKRVYLNFQTARSPSPFGRYHSKVGLVRISEGSVVYVRYPWITDLMRSPCPLHHPLPIPPSQPNSIISCVLAPTNFGCSFTQLRGESHSTSLTREDTKE